MLAQSQRMVERMLTEHGARNQVTHMQDLTIKGWFPLRKISIGSDRTFFDLALSTPPDIGNK